MHVHAIVLQWSVGEAVLGLFDSVSSRPPPIRWKSAGDGGWSQRLAIHAHRQRERAGTLHLVKRPQGSALSRAFPCAHQATHKQQA